jgi:hypothetical protein
MSDPVGQSNVQMGMDESMPDMAEHGEDPQMWELKVKKKRRQQMLRQMLVDAGYGDLAQMTNITQGDNT